MVFWIAYEMTNGGQRPLDQQEQGQQQRRYDEKEAALAQNGGLVAMDAAEYGVPMYDGANDEGMMMGNPYPDPYMTNDLTKSHHQFAESLQMTSSSSSSSSNTHVPYSSYVQHDGVSQQQQQYYHLHQPQQHHLLHQQQSHSYDGGYNNQYHQDVHHWDLHQTSSHHHHQQQQPYYGDLRKSSFDPFDEMEYEHTMNALESDFHVSEPKNCHEPAHMTYSSSSSPAPAGLGSNMMAIPEDFDLDLDLEMIDGNMMKQGKEGEEKKQQQEKKMGVKKESTRMTLIKQENGTNSPLSASGGSIASSSSDGTSSTFSTDREKASKKKSPPGNRYDSVQSVTKIRRITSIDSRKERFQWDHELHDKFLFAIFEIGLELDKQEDIMYYLRNSMKDESDGLAMVKSSMNGLKDNLPKTREVFFEELSKAKMLIRASVKASKVDTGFHCFPLPANTKLSLSFIDFEDVAILVAAIFDVGLKYSRPKRIFTLMQPTPEAMTKPNLKSKLQKYRKNCDKTRDAFWKVYGIKALSLPGSK